jgi:hypothetical protein
MTTARTPPVSRINLSRLADLLRAAADEADVLVIHPEHRLKRHQALRTASLGAGERVSSFDSRAAVSIGSSPLSIEPP